MSMFFLQVDGIAEKGLAVDYQVLKEITDITSNDVHQSWGLGWFGTAG